MKIHEDIVIEVLFQMIPTAITVHHTMIIVVEAKATNGHEEIEMYPTIRTEQVRVG